MKISELNPFIRYCRIHKSHIDTGKIISKCYDCRIFYCVDVSGSIIINGENFNLSNNTAIYLPPATEYKFNLTPESELIVIDFDLINNFDFISDSLGTATKRTFKIEKMPQYEFPSELSCTITKHIPQIKSKLEECTDKFLFKEPYYRELSSALLKMCLIEFVQHQENSIYSQLCKDVLTHIHNNFADHALTNETIAQTFNYHPFHLSRIIKQETGKTLHQYLIFYRLQIAKNYLLTTQHEVSQIAWRTGFCSSAYFVKTFRQNFDITPKQYRKQNLHTEL